MQVIDAEFQPDQRVTNKQTVGFYIHLGKKLQDVLVIGQAAQSVRIPIRRGGAASEDRMVLVAKSLGDDDQSYGSVSVLLEQYFSSLSQDAVVGRQYRQWITLFDHPDDDVYDGILGEDDDEEPRVKIQFTIEEASSQKQVTQKSHSEINVANKGTGANGRGSVK